MALEYLREHVQWVELAGGDVLMEQGQPGDSGYLMLSGRLRIYMRDERGTERMIREIGRGEVIGEMSLFTGEPRSATVVAVRDSVLVKLDKPQFDGLARAEPAGVADADAPDHPATADAARSAVRCPRRSSSACCRSPTACPRARSRANCCRICERFGRVSVLDAAAMDRAIGQEGASASDGDAGDQAVAAALDEIEATNDFVLLIADPAPGPWTRRCVRHSDEILLLADATQPAAVHDAEQACLEGRPARIEAAEILVLLHPADARVPRGTRQWLARRPVTGHVHLRRGLDRDLARLARLLSRKAVGLVFAGGGARGFAHLGTWQALLEQGIEIDCVGGTSIGAAMAALVAADQPMERAIAVARKAIRREPDGRLQLAAADLADQGHRRVRKAIDGSLRELVGEPIAVEDLWKTYFCVATNYSQASRAPHRPRRPRAGAAREHGHSRRVAAGRARRRPAVRRRHVQQLPGGPDARRCAASARCSASTSARARRASSTSTRCRAAGRCCATASARATSGATACRR